MKKDTRKLCEFHNISSHNTNKCHERKSLVFELKASNSDVGSNSKLNLEKGK